MADTNYLSRVIKHPQFVLNENFILHPISSLSTSRKIIKNNLPLIDCIKKYDGPDTFFLIDPPWRIDFYQGRGMTARNKEGHTGAFIDRPAKQYLTDLKQILPMLKGHYIENLKFK